jgi:SHS2 domain-containing protein
VTQQRATVRALEHTADAGIEIEATSLAGLLEGAVAGMIEIVRGGARVGNGETREVRAHGTDPALLLRDLLRNVLSLHEADGFVPIDCVVALEEGTGPIEARCTLRGGALEDPPATELKGVTLHGLAASRVGGAWRARVIFDV